METIFSVRGKRVGVVIEQSNERTSVTVDGEALAIEEVSIDERYVTMRVGARVVRVPYARSGAHVHVAYGGESYEFVPGEEAEDSARGEGAFVPVITSAMAG
jgi:hypothetical protein